MVKGTKTIAQYMICKWIHKNFIDAKIELIDPDIVRMTDAAGEKLTLSINIHEQILDYDTREILSR